MTIRVLMVTPQYYPYLGGFEKQAHTLGKQLARLGVGVSVVTRLHDPALPRYEELEGVTIHRLRSIDAKFGRGCSFTLSLAWFLLANRHRYDVIHVHTFGWYLLGVTPIAKLLRAPTILKLPNVGDCGLPGIRRRRGGAILMQLVKLANAFVAMSNESIDELRGEGIDDSRILRNTNGVDSAVFKPIISDSEKDALRKKHGLPDGKIVLFTGRLTPQKGLADLLSIWSQVLKEVPSAQLVLCGGGEQEYELRQLACHCGIERTVHFVGSVESTVDYYRAADLLAQPSYIEGNSNSILEAMACGLPIVSTEVGGTPQLVGKAGREYLVTPGDQQALLVKLLIILKDPDKASDLGHSFRERTSNVLSIEVVARHYLECYRLLIAKEFHTADCLGDPLSK